MLSQILPVIFLYFLQNKWIVLLNVKCPGKCCSAPLLTRLCRTLPNSLQPWRILPKFDRNTALLAAADVVCDLWMVKL